MGLLLLPVCALAVSAEVRANGASPVASSEAAFNAWLTARGAKLPELELFSNKAEGGRRGVRTRVALQRGSLAALVPHGLLLSAAVARASEPFGTRFLAPALERLPAAAAALTDCDVLALFLAFERGRTRSAWGPYLDVPRDFRRVTWRKRLGGVLDS